MQPRQNTSSPGLFDHASKILFPTKTVRKIIPK